MEITFQQQGATASVNKRFCNAATDSSFFDMILGTAPPLSTWPFDPKDFQIMNIPLSLEDLSFALLM